MTFRDIGRVFVAPLRDRETLLGCGETPFMLPERPFTKDKESYAPTGSAPWMLASVDKVSPGC